MANLKSAKKRVLINTKKKEANNEFRTSMRTSIKKTEKAVLANNKEDAKASLHTAVKNIDKSATKGIVHKNYAARQKSRLTKKVNNME